MSLPDESEVRDVPFAALSQEDQAAIIEWLLQGNSKEDLAQQVAESLTTGQIQEMLDIQKE